MDECIENPWLHEEKSVTDKQYTVGHQPTLLGCEKYYSGSQSTDMFTF